MGTVYRARDLQAARDVALKFLRGDTDPQRVERFRREGQAAARLDHPGIVRVHAAGDHEGRPFLVYELVEGAQGLDLVSPGVSLRRRVEWVRDAARALGYAHDQGLVHRDVKPDNLLVDQGGRVRVADFGLARVRGAERLTKTGAMVGTPFYMSPEQVTDGSAVAAPSDVWSLGVVLYEVLCGARPFDGDSLPALMSQIVDARVPPLRARAPHVAPALEKVCLRALEREPSRRYPSAERLADDLDAWLGGSRVSVEGAGWRRPAVGLAAGVAVAVLIGVLVALATSPPPRAAAAPTTDAVAPTVAPDPTRLAPAADAGEPPLLTEVQALVPTLKDERGLALFLSPTRLVTWSTPRRRGLRIWAVTPAGECRQVAERELETLSSVAVDRSRGLLLTAARNQLSWWRPEEVGDKALLARVDTLERFDLHLFEVAWLPGSAPRVVASGIQEGDTALVMTLEVAEGSGEVRLLDRWSLSGKSAYRVAVRGDGQGILAAHGPHASPNPVEQGFLSLLVPGAPDPRWTSREGQAVSTMAVGPDHETLAVMRLTGRLDVISLTTQAMRSFAGEGIRPNALTGMLEGNLAHGGQGRSVAFLDSETIVSVSGDNRVEGGNELRVWRLRDGKELVSLLDQEHAFYSVAVSPDGRWLALGSMEGPVELRGTRLPASE
jgi:hypothetical protein